jgi:hypothetical protein
MTDRIYATYTPTTVPGTFHTAIHFERTNPAGPVDHYVIEAKPENDKLSAAEKGIGALEQIGRSDGPSCFGNVAASVKSLKPGQFDPTNPSKISSRAPISASSLPECVSSLGE